MNKREKEGLERCLSMRAIKDERSDKKEIDYFELMDRDDDPGIL
jgi:hypothetical protein